MNSWELGKVCEVTKRNKFESLRRGGRVNAGEVWRAPGSDTRYGIDFVPPKIGLPSDGG